MSEPPEKHPDYPYDDDWDYGDPNDPDHHDYIMGCSLSMVYATSPEMYYANAAKLIRRIDELDEEERNILADRIEIPWKRRRGPPSKDTRKFDIHMQYHAKIGNRPKVPRAQAIAEIVRDHRLTPDAAAKAYDDARRYRFRDNGPGISGRKL